MGVWEEKDWVSGIFEGMDFVGIWILNSGKWDCVWFIGWFK